MTQRVKAMVGVLAGVLLASPGVRASDIPLMFTATITSAGTCSWSASPASQTLDATDASDLIGKNTASVTLTGKSITWTISGCPKLGVASVTPRMTVSGTPNTEVPLGGNRAWLSKDAGTAGGTSKGFSIVLMKTATATFTASSLYKIDGTQTIPIGSLGAGANIPDNTQVVLYAGMTCGATTDCLPAGKQAGTLQSTLTFDLVYQ